MPTIARPNAPPRPIPLTTSQPSTDPTPIWARLPVDKRQELRDLLGRLLARLHEARRLGEVGHE